MTQRFNWPIKLQKASTLRLDPENPRIPSGAGVTSQREIIAELVRNDSVLKLAQSIAENGYYPNEIPVTFVSDSKRFVVEGNRRVTAVKCLLSPDAAPEEFQKNFQKLANAMDLKSIESLNVLTAPSRKAAMPLLLDRHTHTQIEKWSRPMQAQFLRRLFDGGMSVEQIAASSRGAVSDVRAMLTADALYQAACAIDFGPKENDRIRNPRTFPLSTLERVFESSAVMDSFGLEKDDEKLLKCTIKKDEFLKGFSRVVRDVTSNKINSRTLNNSASIRKYVDSLGADKPKSTRGRFSIGELSGASGKSALAAKPKPPKKTLPRKSSSVIPTGVRCACKNQRIQDVFQELKKLNLESYPNASALLLRTLLDLAVHNHLELIGRIEELVKASQQKQKKPAEWAPTLRQMLNFMLENVDLGIRGQPLSAIKTFTSGRHDSLCLDGLDKFTHNNYLAPNVKELLNIWVTLGPLMEILLVDPV